MNRYSKNRRGTWFLLIGTFLILLLWQLASSFANRKFFISEFMDRHWYSFKQDQQRQWRPDQMKPDPRIQILSLSYSNRLEFWFDQNAKENLRRIIKEHQGPVLLNFDPSQILKDSILKDIFENPKVIRPVRIESYYGRSEDSYEKIESFLGDFIEQKPYARMKLIDCPANVQRDCMERPIKLFPDELTYYQPGCFYGSLATWKTRESMGLLGGERDHSAHFVFETPLKDLAPRLEIPMPILGAASILEKCQSYFLEQNGNLILKNCPGGQSKTLEASHPLALYFYKQFFEKIDLQSEKKIHLDSALLIEVVDPPSYVLTFHGEQVTWGDLSATALSNLMLGHIPHSSPYQKWIEFFVFILCSSGIIFLSIKSSSLRFLSWLSGILTICLTGDFLLTFLGNWRTEPIEELSSLAILGFVSLALVAKRELEERSLIERAFSGYVSTQRLSQLLTGKERLELMGKKKELTTLLVDIVKFSKLVHDLSSENVFRFIQEFFQLIDPIIFQYGGVIDKKMGDGMLSFFGDSESDQSEQDAAHRAVQAGLEIQRVLSNTTFKHLGISIPVQVRIGINSGAMMVGNAGSQTHFNYTVLGEAVNFTQRLEAACVPGSVLIGESTAAYVDTFFDLEEIEIEAKHETQRFKAYRVLQMKSLLSSKLPQTGNR